VLVADPVLIEQLFHFFRDQIAIVGDGDERDFFAALWLVLGLRWLRLFGLVVHGESIHYSGSKKGSYSKASKEDRSGKVR